MTQVVDAQPVQPGRSGCRPPDAMPESGQPERATLRANEHQVVGGPRTGELLGQRLDHDAGKPDAPVAGSGLGGPEVQVAAYLRDDLRDLDHPAFQVDAASGCGRLRRMEILITTATSRNERDRGARVAVLPVASFEQHGDFLSLITDTIVAYVTVGPVSSGWRSSTATAETACSPTSCSRPMSPALE